MTEITIAANDRRIQYTASGGQTVFPYDFPIFDDGEIAVYRTRSGATTLLTFSTDYTVSGAGAEAGGDVTLTAGATASDIITIVGAMPNARTTDFQEGGDFLAATINRELDRLTIQIQELVGRFGRTLLLGAASAHANLIVPDPASGKFLRWRADLTGLENADLAGSGSIGLPVAIAQGGTGATTAAGALTALGISAFAQTLADDVDAAAARATLGLALGAGVRERLTAARTYYVRTDGSDANTGLANTAGGAFLTIQKAINVVARNLDLNGNVVTIQIADGTYNEALVLPPLVGAPDGVGAILLGNTGTPSNVHVNTTGAGDSFKVLRGSNEWKIDSLKASSANGSAVSSDLTNAGPCSVVINSMHVGACPNGYHFRAEKQGIFRISGNFTVSGNAGALFLATELGHVLCQGMTITLTGTPAFSLATAYARGCGVMRINGITFSGSATGKRYDASDNGDIQTSGGGASYVPGNSAGSTATGGQYT